MKKLLLTGFVSLMLVFAACGNAGEENNNNKNGDNGNRSENVNLDEENNEDENNAGDTNEGNAGASELDGKVSFGQIAYTLPEEAVEMDIGDQIMPIVLYMLEEESGTSFNVVEEELPDNMNLTLEEYIEFAIENGAASGIEYTDNKDLEINGKEWNQLEGISQGLPLLQRTVIFNNTAYIFSLSSGSEESYEEAKQIFYDVTESVEETTN